jgi:hypothetical protein
MAHAHDDKRERTSRFHWQTKQELYGFFTTAYCITRDEIDMEIDSAVTSFQLRKGQAIKTQELWQKVGLNLIKKLGVDSPTHTRGTTYHHDSHRLHSKSG